MTAAGGTCIGAPGARQDDRQAWWLAVLTVLVLALGGCGAESYRVPWEVSSPAPGRYMGPPPHEVVVQRGDTVYGLSRRYGVPMRDMIEANRLAPPYTLYVGQRLTFPRSRVHVVRRGDTLSAIARSYQVDMNAMARVNRLGAPYVIQVGQHLLIPSDDPAPAPRQAAGPAVAAAATPVPTGKPATATAPAPSPAKPAAPQQQASARPAAKPQPTAAPARAPAPVAAKPPTPPSRAAASFGWPVEGKVISRFGGKADGTRNDGINIAASRGAPVKAAENGVVVYSGNELKGFGNLLLIKHEGGWMSAYAHNELLLVKKGETVRRGQTIARVGSSGNVTSPQLHFEIRRGSKAVDPLQHLGKQMAAVQ